MSVLPSQLRFFVGKVETMGTVDDEALIKLCKTEELTERERAELEAQIWESATSETRLKYTRHQYLAMLLGGSCYDYITRGVLFNAGDAAEFFWDRLDRKDMTPGTAARMLREAKREARDTANTMADVLAKKFEDYDKLPVAKLADGRAFRKRHGNRFNSPASMILRGGVQTIPPAQPERHLTIAELVVRHKAETSGPKLADIEELIWAKASKEDRRTHRREAYIASIIGSKSDAIRIRAVLRSSGAAAQQLWERLENEGMPYSTASRLLSDAKRRVVRRKKLKIEDALFEILKQYDTLNVTHRPDGKQVRVRGVSRLPDLDKEKWKIRMHIKTAEKSPENFWTRMRNEIAAHIAIKLVDIEPGIAQELWLGLENDLRALTAEFQTRIERSKCLVTRQLVSRRGIVDACRILGIDLPKRGGSVDIKLAAKRKRMLVREYHPDASGGNERRDKMEDVVKAYHVIESYNKQVGVVVVNKSVTN